MYNDFIVCKVKHNASKNQYLYFQNRNITNYISKYLTTFSCFSIRCVGIWQSINPFSGRIKNLYKSRSLKGVTTHFANTMF